MWQVVKPDYWALKRRAREMDASVDKLAVVSSSYGLFTSSLTPRLTLLIMNSLDAKLSREPENPGRHQGSQNPGEGG